MLILEVLSLAWLPPSSPALSTSRITFITCEHQHHYPSANIMSSSPANINIIIHLPTSCHHLWTWCQHHYPSANIMSSSPPVMATSCITSKHKVIHPLWTSGCSSPVNIMLFITCEHHAVQHLGTTQHPTPVNTMSFITCEQHIIHNCKHHIIHQLWTKHQSAPVNTSFITSKLHAIHCLWTYHHLSSVKIMSFITMNIMSLITPHVTRMFMKSKLHVMVLEQIYLRTSYSNRSPPMHNTHEDLGLYI